MNKINCYFVDAFTHQIFKGNPAAICVLEKPLNDDLMQKIAQEHNLSETAFVYPQNNSSFFIQWFTPKQEIDLCGHATLAAAFVILNYIQKGERVLFKTKKSGELIINKNKHLYSMAFPIFPVKPFPLTEDLKNKIKKAVGVCPLELYLGRDLVCVCALDEIGRAEPQFGLLLELPGELFHLTARDGKTFDCQSRSFAPKHGVLEDPVCGAGHCHIAPLWAEKLGKSTIYAYQASKRGGVLHCVVEQNKIHLSGEAVLYATSQIYLNSN